MEHVAHFFFGLVERFSYPGLFAVMMLGNLGVPVATEFVMLAAGSLAATGHLSSVFAVGLVATVGELVGNSILYAVGYVGGRPLVEKYGRYVKLDIKKLDMFHRYYEKYGNITVLVCRVLPFVRGLSALPAGVSRMQKRYFFAYTLLGSAFFCFGLAYLGAAFANHRDELAAHVHTILFSLLGLVIVGVVAFIIYRRTRPAAPAP
jgi:membrane protein DedA with SNARE-associated domain